MHARAWTYNAREISPKLVSQLVSVAPDLLKQETARLLLV